MNISRFHNIDPEDALRFTAEKFIRRFSYIEQNIEVGHSTMDRMDYLWDEIKRMERRGNKPLLLSCLEVCYSAFTTFAA